MSVHVLIFSSFWYNVKCKQKKRDQITKVPFNRKARGQWPIAIHIWSVWIFAVLFSAVFGCSFLDSVPLFGFLSKLYGFLASNLKLIYWTGLYCGLILTSPIIFYFTRMSEFSLHLGATIDFSHFWGNRTLFFCLQYALRISKNYLTTEDTWTDVKQSFL